MKLPRSIRSALRKCYSFNAEANAQMRIVEEWLTYNGIDPEELRDGSGVGLDEIEYAANPSAVEDVIARIESDC